MAFYCLQFIVAVFIIFYRKPKFFDEESKRIGETDGNSESLIWEREGKFRFGDLVYRPLRTSMRSTTLEKVDLELFTE